MRTVLIADDEPSLRLLVNATISSDEYAVVQACDGDEAWVMVQTHRPTVVLLDVQMPGRSGLEVARLIRAEPGLAGTKIILLTSKAQETDVRAGYEAGADRYLTKPFSPLELLDTVERAIDAEPSE